MRRFVTIPAIVLAATSATSAQRQQPHPADQTRIRELIANYDKGAAVARTSDVVFWSGAYKRPTVGAERGEEVSNGRQPSLRVPGSQRTRTVPVRIEFSAGGDMAYEYSNANLSFDLKSGAKQELQTSILRVWRKEAGQWKIAAMFARPHEP
jgi:ketosteroid isomerase-like protein